GKIAEALEHSREAVRVAPQTADFHFNLARTLAVAGQRDEAVKEFREVLRINPADADARKELARLLAGP
ncbi:MAG TPA: tetratricopeptide repeat protein, partial [Phycisphaerae bacterium]|nr:tetratricopeptide repeat protein [Phycisphaerae bacterium]